MMLRGQFFENLEEDSWLYYYYLLETIRLEIYQCDIETAMPVSTSIALFELQTFLSFLGTVS